MPESSIGNLTGLPREMMMNSEKATIDN